MGLRSTLKGVIKKALGMESKAPERRAPPPRPPIEEEEEDHPGASMANIECGGQELKERVDAGEAIVIVDVRTNGEVATGVIPGARHIPVQELHQRWEELSDADEIVCYCAAGARSFSAAMLLREKGLINATSLEGGVPAWTDAGGELVAFEA